MAINSEEDSGNPIRDLGPDLPKIGLNFFHQWHPQWPTELYGLPVFTYRLLVRRRQGFQPPTDRFASCVCPEENDVKPDLSDTHSTLVYHNGYIGQVGFSVNLPETIS